MTTFSLQQFTRQSLRNHIERRYQQGADRDFVIQYGRFQRHPTDKLRWYISTIIDECHDESFYTVNVSPADHTNVVFESRKDCYPSFTMNQLGSELKDDYSGGRISVSALFPDYKPRHFTGTCETRGGFTGNGWIEIKIPE